MSWSDDSTHHRSPQRVASSDAFLSALLAGLALLLLSTACPAEPTITILNVKPLARRAGQRVAAHSLQIALQLYVAAGDAVQEPVPERTVSAGGDSSHVREIVLGAMLAHNAG
jgi:hypothetical protein